MRPNVFDEFEKPLPKCLTKCPDAQIRELVSPPSTHELLTELIRKFPDAPDDFFREKCYEAGHTLYRVTAVVNKGFLHHSSYVTLERLSDGGTINVYADRPFAQTFVLLRELKRFCLESAESASTAA